MSENTGKLRTRTKLFYGIGDLGNATVNSAIQFFLMKFYTDGALILPALAGNALLIGNVEDGKINAFNPDTGAFLGPLTDSNNNPIVIPGLWDLSFGDGRNNGRANQLFFDAGFDAANPSGNGLFGVILAEGAQGD